MELHVPQRQEEIGTQGKSAREREQCVYAQEKQKTKRDRLQSSSSKTALIPPLEYEIFTVS